MNNATADKQRGLATVAETMDYLNVSRSTVYELIDAGKIEAKRIGRARRITWLSILEFVADAD